MRLTLVFSGTSEYNRYMKKVITTVGIIVVITLSAAAGWLFILNLRSGIDGLKLPDPITIVNVPFADKQLARMTLRQKVSSLLVLHIAGTDKATLQEYLKTYQPGGLIFMGDNIPPTLDQLTATTKALQTNPALPYLFAIDEEGGIVKRLPQDNLPSAIDLKSLPVADTKSAFSQRSTMLKQVGMNLNFGIVADVTSDPLSFIYPRVFGGNPLAVADRVAAAVTGANGLTLSTLKHYPGHGETEADSHNSIPTTAVSFERWQQNDEPSFVAGIKAGAQVVMFGQLAYSAVDSLPASLSAKWHDILKTRDGFNGITITDDMVMLQQSGDSNYADPVANSIAALNAGNTMLLFVLDHGGYSNFSPNILIDGLVAAVKNGQISQKTIDNDVRQVLILRHSLPIILK